MLVKFIINLHKMPSSFFMQNKPVSFITIKTDNLLFSCVQIPVIDFLYFPGETINYHLKKDIILSKF